MNLSNQHPLDPRLDAEDREAIKANLAERIELANPYHDKAGRFTTGPKQSNVLDAAKEPGGGGTFDLRGNHVTTGYAVGGLAPSTAATAAAFAKHGPELYKDFVKKNRKALMSPGTTTGIYHDAADGMVFLDVSQNIPDGRGSLEAAKRLGRERNERSIYHLTSGELIDTGGTGGV